MKLDRRFFVVSALAFCALLIGCGGGGGGGSSSSGGGLTSTTGTSATSNTGSGGSSSGDVGSLAVQLQWPQASRAIPSYAKSVVITLKKGTDDLDSKTVTRSGSAAYQQTVSFKQIPAGQVVVNGLAKTEDAGQGDTVASFSSMVTVQSGKTASMSASTAMASTVQSVAIDSSTGPYEAGGQFNLVGHAVDGNNAALFLEAGSLQWSVISGLQFASVTSNGVLTALSAGTVTVQLKDPASGKTAQKTLTIIAGSTGGGTGGTTTTGGTTGGTTTSGGSTGETGLANSPWPKFMRDAQNTGYANVAKVQGTVDWTYTLPNDSFVTSGMSLGSDETLYAFVKGGKLVALNGSSGALKWSLDVPFVGSLWPKSTPLVSANGSLYFGSTDGTFYAVNAATGTIRWSKAVGSAVRSSPTMTSDGKVIINGQNGQVVCYNGDSGSVLWSVPAIDINQNSDTSPVLSADEKTVFVPGFRIRAIDTQTGNVKWTTVAKHDTVGEMSLNGAGVLFVTEWGGLEALNASTGARLWEGSLPYIPMSSPLIGASGNVYYTSGAGPGGGPNIFAYNASSGAQVWNVTTNVSSNGAVVGGDVVYATNLFAGKILEYSASTGQPVGEIAWPNSTSGMFANAMIFGTDGALYVGGNGAIIKFR